MVRCLASNSLHVTRHPAAPCPHLLQELLLQRLLQLRRNVQKALLARCHLAVALPHAPQLQLRSGLPGAHAAHLELRDGGGVLGSGQSCRQVLQPLPVLRLLGGLVQQVALAVAGGALCGRRGGG